MDYRTLELKVGLAVFIAVMIFSLGIFWLEGYKIGAKWYEIHAVFPMVGGVDRGDMVRVNGVERGEVRNVVLRRHDVLVTMRIEAQTKIPDDSRVVLQTLGIMGERAVTILIGRSSGYLAPGAVVEGVYDPGIPEALASFGSAMDDLRGLVVDLRGVAGAFGEGDRLRLALENLAAVSADLRLLVEETAPGMRGGMRSFHSSAARLDSLLARNEARIDTLLGRFDAAGEALPELVEGVTEVTRSLRSVSERLGTSDGTLGALLNDRELLERLESAIMGLDELVLDIKANPKKYLKVSIF